MSMGATRKDDNLVWIDLEMSGLDPYEDKILEIATLVTDKELNIIAEGPVYSIYQPESVLELMDDWNMEHHTESGLLERVRTSKISEQEAQDETMAFLKQFVPFGASPMCGNSICQDRRFLYKHMRRLEEFFHYRNVDVSTLKELVRRWKPEVLKKVVKSGKHEALADIRESIEELKVYRQEVLTM